MKRKKIDIKKIDRNMDGKNAGSEGLSWHSPKKQPFHIAGLPWFQEEGLYRRLPIKPREPIPKSVDYLANCTAGGQMRFRTDSQRLVLRIKKHGSFHMVHMADTGQGGFDCYIGAPGKTTFCSATKYDSKLDDYELVLFKHDVSETRMITLNFPLYNDARQMEIEIGLAPGAKIEAPVPYDNAGRIVVYGTSITQGGCASRPGMCFTNILSRRINMEFVNLGFSGSGRGEPEVARLVATVKRPAIFVLDFEGNCHEPELLAIRFPEFVDILRKAHPSVPILTVSKIRFASTLYEPTEAAKTDRCRSIQKEEVRKRILAGDKNLYFANGYEFLGKDFDECTVDGVHATDLGFLRMADALEPYLRKILAKATVSAVKTKR